MKEMNPTTQVCVNCCSESKNDFIFGYEVGCMGISLKTNKKTNKNELWTVKDLIEALSKFPQDMLVAVSLSNYDDVEKVHSVDIDKAILYNGQICERGFDLGGIEAPEIDVVMVW